MGGPSFFASDPFPALRPDLLSFFIEAAAVTV